MKKTALFFAGLLCMAQVASAMFLGTEDAAPGFVTMDGTKNNLEFHYPRMSEGKFLKRVRINSAIEREILHWEGESIKPEDGRAWMHWFSGYTGEDAKSFILTESTYYTHAAHPTTYAKGMTFDKEGHLVTREEILKRIGTRKAADIIKLVFEQTTERKIPVFEETLMQLTDWPKEFYIGKDGTIYFIFQQYEIAPYSSGIIEISAGRI